MNRVEWDLHAAKFESLVCDIVTDETSGQMPRFVAAACRSRKNLELVDLGCGVGSFVKKFGHRFERITGIDFAPRIVARARKRCADLPRLPCGRVVRHVCTPGNLLQVICYR